MTIFSGLFQFCKMKTGKNIQEHLKVQADLDVKAPSSRNGSGEEKHFELHCESSDKVV